VGLSKLGRVRLATETPQACHRGDTLQLAGGRSLFERNGRFNCDKPYSYASADVGNGVDFEDEVVNLRYYPPSLCEVSPRHRLRQDQRATSHVDVAGRFQRGTKKPPSLDEVANMVSYLY